MPRSDPSRWTPAEVEKLVARARQKGATLESLGEHYHVTGSAIATILKQAGVHLELSALRKQWRLEQNAEQKRALVAEVLAKAKIEVWTRKLYAREQVEKLQQVRACIECGNAFTNINPRAVCCSAECRRVRKNRIKSKRRTSTWELWAKRDYDELVVTLRMCGGSIHKAAKVLNVSRYAMHSAVTRWGLRDELEQVRADSTAEKVKQAAELIRNGMGMRPAAGRVGILMRNIKPLLIKHGYAEVLHTQKCLCCGTLFQRQKIQDRCCSAACSKERERRRWKQVALRKAAAKQKRQKAKAIAVEKELIRRSKHL
jgi:hypothetical protein